MLGADCIVPAWFRLCKFVMLLTWIIEVRLMNFAPALAHCSLDAYSLLRMVSTLAHQFTDQRTKQRVNKKINKRLRNKLIDINMTNHSFSQLFWTCTPCSLLCECYEHLKDKTAVKIIQDEKGSLEVFSGISKTPVIIIHKIFCFFNISKSEELKRRKDHGWWRVT